METKYITNNPNQTKKLGEKFAKEILELKQRKTVVNQPRSCFLDGAFVIGLKGELGGGKTCFLQGFAKGLGVKEKILSRFTTEQILDAREVARIISERIVCKCDWCRTISKSLRM